MFDYIYGDKCGRFSFIRLPQVLFTDERFRPLSSDTKILYALLLDRTGLSIKKHWLDAEGRVYINFPLAEISEKLGVGMQKAGKLMRELEAFGLIERERLGLGKPDRIFVKHCGKQTDADEADSDTEITVENLDDTGLSDIPNSSFQNAENHHSGDAFFTGLDVPKSQLPLYNQTEKARLKQSYPIHPDSGRSDRMEYAAQRDSYERLIKENIEYNWFISVFQMPKSDPHRPKGSLDELDDLVAVMLDCVCSTAPVIRVNGQDMPTDVVRSQMLKLNNEHIQYVFERMYQHTSEITNIRAYLITVLYNAPMTMNTAFGVDFRTSFGEFI